MTQYWFKRKRYGWGLTAVTWQGWLSIAIYLLAVLGGLWAVRDMPKDGFPKEASMYLLFVLVATIIMIVVSHRHGPTLKWRWGSRSSDNPEEDA